MISCSSLCLTEVSPPQGQFSASSTEKLMGRSAEDSEVFFMLYILFWCAPLYVQRAMAVCLRVIDAL